MLKFLSNIKDWKTTLSGLMLAVPAIVYGISTMDWNEYTIEAILFGVVSIFLPDFFTKSEREAVKERFKNAKKKNKNKAGLMLVLLLVPYLSFSQNNVTADIVRAKQIIALETGSKADSTITIKYDTLNQWFVNYYDSLYTLRDFVNSFGGGLKNIIDYGNGVINSESGSGAFRWDNVQINGNTITSNLQDLVLVSATPAVRVWDNLIPHTSGKNLGQPGELSWGAIYGNSLWLNDYRLPYSDGTAGQVMTTDGNGNVSFQDGGGETPDLQAVLDAGNTGSSGSMDYSLGSDFQVLSGGGLNSEFSFSRFNSILEHKNFGGAGLSTAVMSGDENDYIEMGMRGFSNDVPRNLRILEGFGLVYMEGHDSDTIVHFNSDEVKINSLGNIDLHSEEEVRVSGDIIVIDGDINIPDGDLTVGNGTFALNGMAYPSTDGTAGQVITTDGNGTLSFQDGGSGGLQNLEDDGSNVINSSTGTGNFTWRSVRLMNDGIFSETEQLSLGVVTGPISVDAGLVITATQTLIGQTLHMQNNRITTMANPIDNQDGATKIYVDNYFSQGEFTPVFTNEGGSLSNEQSFYTLSGNMITINITASFSSNAINQPVQINIPFSVATQNSPTGAVNGLASMGTSGGATYLPLASYILTTGTPSTVRIDRLDGSDLDYDELGGQTLNITYTFRCNDCTP